MPGALSAVGILLADAVRDYSRTVMLPGDALNRLDEHFAALEARGTAKFTNGDAVAERSLDLRYRGQGYELNIPYSPNAAEAFHALHEQRYGFFDRTRPLEIVNLRLRLRVPAEPYSPIAQEVFAGSGSQAIRETREVIFDGAAIDTRTYTRDLLRPGDIIAGPALITEYTSTTVLLPGCRLEVDRFSNLVIQVDPEARA
jgi:N-methylhydantoinase A